MHQAWPTDPTGFERLVGVVDAMVAIAQAETPERLFMAATVAARQVLCAELSVFFLVDEERGNLQVVAWDGSVDSTAVRGLSTPVGRHLAGLCAQTGQVISCPDVPSDTRSNLSAARECGIVSAVLVPVVVSGVVRAVLVVDSYRQREFSKAEEQLLYRVAAACARSFETLERDVSRTANAAVHAELVATRAELSRTHEIRFTARRLASKLAAAGLEEFLAELSSELRADAAITVFGAGCIAATDAGRQRAMQLAPSSWPDDDDMTPELLPGKGFVVPLIWNEAVEGLLFVPRDDLSDSELLLVETAGRLTASHLDRLRISAEAEIKVMGGLLERLATEGGSATPSALLAVVNHDVHPPLCAVAVDLGNLTSSERVDAVAAFHAARTEAGLGGLAGAHHDSVAGLLWSADRQLTRESVERWAARFLQSSAGRRGRPKATVAVSRIQDRIDEIPRELKRARQALDVHQSLGDDETDVTFFEDVELLTLLLDLGNRTVVHELVTRCVGQLIDYDRRKGGDLAHTLEVFLDKRCVVRHASEALHLHAHSLRYRLRRVQEIQGLDLKDPMQRLEAHLALKARKMVADIAPA
jgi:GAF domain-containing protein